MPVSPGPLAAVSFQRRAVHKHVVVELLDVLGQLLEYLSLVLLLDSLQPGRDLLQQLLQRQES